MLEAEEALCGLLTSEPMRGGSPATLPGPAYCGNRNVLRLNKLVNGNLWPGVLPLCELHHNSDQIKSFFNNIYHGPGRTPALGLSL